MFYVEFVRKRNAISLCDEVADSVFACEDKNNLNVVFRLPGHIRGGRMEDLICLNHGKSNLILKVTWPESDQYRQCILNDGPTLYNGLSSHIRNINNIDSFKFVFKLYHVL